MKRATVAVLVLMIWAASVWGADVGWSEGGSPTLSITDPAKDAVAWGKTPEVKGVISSGGTDLDPNGNVITKMRIQWKLEIFKAGESDACASSSGTITTTTPKTVTLSKSGLAPGEYTIKLTGNIIARNGSTVLGTETTDKNITVVKLAFQNVPSELDAKASAAMGATVEPTGRTINWKLVKNPAGVNASLDNSQGTSNTLWAAKTEANTADGTATVKIYDTDVGEADAVTADVPIHQFRRGTLAAGNATGGLSSGADSISYTVYAWSDQEKIGSDASRKTYTNIYTVNSNGDHGIGEVKLVRTIAGSVTTTATSNIGFFSSADAYAACGYHVASNQQTLNAQIDKTVYATAGYGSTESVTIGASQKGGVSGAYTFTRAGNQPSPAAQTWSVESQRKYSFSPTGTQYELEATIDFWWAEYMKFHIPWDSGGQIEFGTIVVCATTWSVTDNTGNPSLTPAPFAQTGGHNMTVTQGAAAN